MSIRKSLNFANTKLFRNDAFHIILKQLFYNWKEKKKLARRKSMMFLMNITKERALFKKQHIFSLWPRDWNVYFGTPGYGFDFTNNQKDFFSRVSVRFLVQTGRNSPNLPINLATKLVVFTKEPFSILQYMKPLYFVEFEYKDT